LDNLFRDFTMPTIENGHSIKTDETATSRGAVSPAVAVQSKPGGPSADAEHPAMIGRYRIVKKLGAGAMGQVYAAEDPVLERRIAIKIVPLDPHLPAAVRQAYLARFADEAKASARLDHPSIVQVYDAGLENEIPWIAFQLVEGENLDAMLKRRGKLSVRRAVLFTLDIAAALQHAHANSIIHRDIKPANILIEQHSGIAKLSDFGIIQAPWALPDAEGTIVGSPGYMSPEQIEGIELDQRSDLFSLGVVLYQMVSGVHPFLCRTLRATLDATRKGEYAPLHELVADVPRDLDKAVHRCLYADRRMRMRSAAELADLLRPLAGEESTGESSGTGTRLFVESRATETTAAPAGAVGHLFVRLNILRVYTTTAKWLQRSFAKLMKRDESFSGETLEQFATTLTNWVTQTRKTVRLSNLRGLVDRIADGAGLSPRLVWIVLAISGSGLTMGLLLLLMRAF
jgi:serine/threonine protein kinase